jgi:hypothetical protein
LQLLTINTALDWISKAFGKRVTDKDDPPRYVLDTIQAIVPAKGWQAFETQRSETIIAPGPGVQTVLSSSPPQGEWWWIYQADVRHNEAANKDVRFDKYTQQTNTATAIQQVRTIGQFVFLALERPMLLLPGDILAAESVQVVGGGFNWQLRYTYLPLAPGEYLPGVNPLAGGGQ